MKRFAIAIHGGAGVIERTIPENRKREYLSSLESILQVGRDLLENGSCSLDVVERVVRLFEDDPKFNAGKGAVYDSDGTHELEASIMDGATLRCGAVAGLRTVKNPVMLARLVMERTNHIFLMGDGAEAFADAMKVERVENAYFDTEHRYRQLEVWKAKSNGETSRVIEDDDDDPTGTVGCVALDGAGSLAAATSTGGRTGKMRGRVGDTPIIGAGNYANNLSCAVSATGNGEAFLRNCVGRDIAALMEYGGKRLADAAHEIVYDRLSVGDGGVIAVSREGEIVMPFNSKGMFRGAADSEGRFEVRIWK